jgi:uncharacterized membrane protein
MSRLYWLAASLLVAITVHVFYVLFVPAMALERQIERVLTAPEPGKFTVLEAEAQAALFPAFPATSVFGVCQFDVADKDIVVNADLPQGFWTLSIYTQTGKTLYVLNDRQSGTNQFSVRLTKASSLLDAFRETADADIETAGWKVETSVPEGLAVFWLQPQDMLHRPRVAEALARTTCAPAKS